MRWSGRRRLCELVVDDGWSLTAAAAASGVSVGCARKWVGRYRLAGSAGLFDRSSAPRRVANRTADDRVEAIVKLRKLRFTAAEIAETLGMALSTVSGILTRLGIGRLGRLGLEQPVRYERARPGELVHIDVKKLGKIVRPGHRVTGRVSGSGHHRRSYHRGWEFVHVAVDDYSRFAYAEVLADEKAVTIVGFLRRALAYYRRHGITVERVLTDNVLLFRRVLRRRRLRGEWRLFDRNVPWRQDRLASSTELIEVGPREIDRASAAGVGALADEGDQAALGPEELSAEVVDVTAVDGHGSQ